MNGGAAADPLAAPRGRKLTVAIQAWAASFHIVLSAESAGRMDTIQAKQGRAQTMRRLVGAMLLASAAAMSGCGSTYSLKEFSPQDGQAKSALIDIKQRAILTSKRPPGQPGSNGDLVMCAEPSPDALASLASEFAADAKYKDSVTATLGFSQQESSSFVGLRTQTIQLLRDGMYRLCEGYLSGALSQADFAWLSRRYQKYMVALLTIEQLTRVAQVPSLAQTSQGSAAATRSALAIQSDLEALDKTLARLNDERRKIADEKAEVEKLAETDTAKSGKLGDVQSRLDASQASINRTGEIRSAMLEGLRSARGVLLNGSTAVQIFGDSQDKRAMASIEAVSKAIAVIAEKVLDQDDLPTLCFQVLDGSRTSAGVDPKLKENCLKVFEARAASDNAKAEVLRKLDVQKLISDIKPPNPISWDPGSGTVRQLSDEELQRRINQLFKGSPMATNPKLEDFLKKLPPELRDQLKEIS